MKAMSVFSLLIFLFIITSSTAISAQSPTPPPTELLTGDIAIVGFNTDDTDEFIFVALRDINPLTEIRFTDRAWSNYQIPPGFLQPTSNDNEFSYTSSVAIKAGEVIRISSNPDHEFYFSAIGDQIFAYTANGSEINKVLFGVNTYTSIWLAECGDPKICFNENNSQLPPDLSENTSINFGGYDNAYFDIPRNFTSPTEALEAIVNIGNWKTSYTRLILPTTNFEFTTTDVLVQNFNVREKYPWLISIILLFTGALFISLNYSIRRKQN